MSRTSKRGGAKGSGNGAGAPAREAVRSPAANRLRIRRIASTSLLSAVALVLSYVESMIPLPVTVPGIKLGLGNIAVVVALFMYDAPTAALVAGVKVLASGLLFGSPTMLLYSLGGTALAFLGMWAMHLIPGIDVVPVSMVSAILHNVGQLAVAALMLGTSSVFVSLPLMAVVSCATGAITGFVATKVLEGLRADEGGPGRPVVDISCLALQPGEHIAFVGPNGSGKTSCALELAGLAEAEFDTDPETGMPDPATGFAGFGRPVRQEEAGDDPEEDAAEAAEAMVDLVQEEANRRSGVAFQDPDSQIVASVVRDDVAFGLENRGVGREEMERVVAEALEEVGIAALAERDVSSLSGGQKQRTAIAGLLALAPDLVIFDESTSMLDAAARERFSKLVHSLTGRGLTVVTITQIMDEAFEADRVAVFSDGEIIAVKTPDELLTDPSPLEEAGVELPPTARLAAQLRADGLDVPLTNDMDALEAAIWRSSATA